MGDVPPMDGGAAHKSHTAIGVATKTDRQRLTSIDWRGNRLVDALAKAAASSLSAPTAVSSFLRSADAAAAHAACMLRVVTHAANNFRSCVLTEGGASVTTITRDSTDRPRHLAGERFLPAVPVRRRPCRSSSALPSVLPWRAPTPQVQANRLQRAASESALVRRVEEIGARLSPSLCKPPALPPSDWPHWRFVSRPSLSLAAFAGPELAWLSREFGCAV